MHGTATARPPAAAASSVWLLLHMWASPRANHAIRTMPPSQSAAYANAHDEAIWQTLHGRLGLGEDAAPCLCEEDEARKILIEEGWRTGRAAGNFRPAWPDDDGPTSAATPRVSPLTCASHPQPHEDADHSAAAPQADALPPNSLAAGSNAWSRSSAFARNVRRLLFALRPLEAGPDDGKASSLSQSNHP